MKPVIIIVVVIVVAVVMIEGVVYMVNNSDKFSGGFGGVDLNDVFEDVQLELSYAQSDDHLELILEDKVKELVKQPKLDKKDKVWTNNQLAPDVFDKLKVKELCVPSEKEL